MDTERRFFLKDSVKLLKEENAKEDFNEFVEGIKYDDKVRQCLSIKKCNLSVLNTLKCIVSEICDCLIIDANQAAITLTNNLLENLLKQSLIMWDSKGKELKGLGLLDTTFENEIREHGDSNLEPNINKCKSKGIISKNEAEQLKSFKVDYRNSFSHASVPNLLEGETVQIRRKLINISELSLSTIENVDISKMPDVRGELQQFFSNDNALRYFIEVHNYVNEIDHRLLFHLYPEQ